MKQPTPIFAADNMIVELKIVNVMAGIFFFFVLIVAVGSLMDCYVKGLNQKEAGR